MHPHSLTMPQNNQKQPIVISDTHHAYPFTKTPRFMQPSPKYAPINTVALKPSTTIKLNCHTEQLGWATAKRLIFRRYYPTILRQIVIKSSLSSSR